MEITGENPVVAGDFVTSPRFVKRKEQGETHLLLSPERDTRKQEACMQRETGVYYSP